MQPTMQQTLQNKDYTTGDSFNCKGQSLALNRGHPNQQNIQGAKAFAKQLTTNSYTQTVRIH
ncbi:MAG: hypothetical protein NWF04_00170 [Candidatus Bathyarchaeota archaeon]|nr:hypothetical protein [Candidatus Bathyarchaeota archaeon]